MTDNPQNPSTPAAQTPVEAETLLRSLRRKEGTWVEWGQACQTLQKEGYTPQTIFEETGFEPIHQNQIIVAMQVYTSIVTVGVPDAVKQHFTQKGSDILYELRILAQNDRAAVAILVLEKGLDTDEVHEVAKAVKEYSRLAGIPEKFTAHPGDAVAYQAWKLARQKSDLQERSRLIARGLKFAHSAGARQQVEGLLTDFSVTPTKSAPRLPIYRLDSEEELPRVIPVVGRLPLTKADLQAVPLVEEIAPFNLVKFSGAGAWIPVPGWQVILAAADPVAILCASDRLPTPLPGEVEDVLVVIDRAKRTWNDECYFVVEQDNQLQIQWFAQSPELSMLGQVILMMRPKKVLEAGYTTNVLSEDQQSILSKWQFDE